jgi:hypothetical protein
VDPESEKKSGSFEDAGRRIDSEVEELIRWFNNDVVPSVRQQSSRALRKAAEKLAQFADHMDDPKREK